MTLVKWLETKAHVVVCGPDCPWCSAEAQIIAIVFAEEEPKPMPNEKDTAMRAATAAWVLAVLKILLVAAVLAPLVWRK